MPENQFVNDEYAGSGGDDSENEEEKVDETELRNGIAQAALSWVGTTEGSARHAEIVEIFNSISPGAPITMASSWCAAFASVCAYQAGVDNLIYVNASCGNQISWFNGHGEFVYGNSYMPRVGDFVYYDWDPGTGADHVGIVVSVGNNSYTVVEGNRDGHGNPDYVGTRYLEVGSSIVYGFGLPNYGSNTRTGVQLRYQPVGYSPPKTSNWEAWMDDIGQNWLRRYRLDVGITGQPGGFSIGEFKGPNNPPLRIWFNVEKAELTTWNNSTIKIWNLGREHRELISTPGSRVYLYAGYGKTLPILTQGAVVKSVDSLEGGDLVTEIEIFDTIDKRGTRDTYVCLQYAEMTSWKTVLEDTLQQMGMLPSSVEGFDYLPWGNTSPGGYSFVGAASKALNAICLANNYVCTILNGVIVIRRPGEVAKDMAIVLSAETGLIGNPKKLIETVDSVYYLRGWEVEFLMNGTIDLGTWIRLESPFIDIGYGYYTVVELNITGDSMSGDWKCTAKLEDPNFHENKLFDPDEWGSKNGVSYVKDGSTWPSHKSGKF